MGIYGILLVSQKPIGKGGPMDHQVTKMTAHHEKPLEEIVEHLKKEEPGQLVAEIPRHADGHKVVLLVFEKYYWRNGSYANLTVLLTETPEVQTADIIGSGGGEGLFNFSWGANEHFADEAARILADCGFHE